MGSAPSSSDASGTGRLPQASDRDISTTNMEQDHVLPSPHPDTEAEARKTNSADNDETTVGSKPTNHAGEDNGPETKQNDKKDTNDHSENTTGKVTNPLTEQQLIQQLEAYLGEDRDLFRQTGEHWATRSSSDWVEDEAYVDAMTLYLQKISSSYSRYKGDRISLALQREYLVKSKEELAHWPASQAACDIAVELLQNGQYFTVDEATGQRQINQVRYRLLRVTLSALWNSTDLSPPVCRVVRDHPSFFPEVVASLEVWLSQFKGGTMVGIEQIITRACLSITGNVALNADCVQRLREIPKCFDVLKAFVDQDKHEVWQFRAILVLADVATDVEANQLATNPKMIRIVLSIFGKAVTDKKHRASLNGESTFSAEELAHAVKQLSRNNTNSRELVKNGALRILSQGLKFESEAERKVFMESLWWLSFVEENRAEMVQDQELLDQTIAIYHDKDKYQQCHEAAEGMLFQLVEKLQTLDNKKYGPLVEQLKGQKTQTVSKSGHVMLSYNRENRPVVTKICDFLKNNGITSWMDIYNMPEADGSTTQMMAEAVENAVIFLMCVSEGYKNSQYCRQEAEYANRRRKMIVPLQMQARYDPDGWLGFIMGNDYFLDFSREELHQDKLGKLLVKVKKAFAGTQDSVDGPVIPVKSTPTKAAPTTPVIDHSHGGMVFSAPPPAAESHRLPSAALDQIRNWTHEDIKRWQQKFDISGKNVMSLNGKELAFLRVMKTEAPDFFYQMLVTQLQLKSVSAMANFTYGLEEIHTMLN